VRKYCEESLKTCCGEAADKSEDNVSFEDGERIVDDDGEEEDGEGGSVEGIPDGSGPGDDQSVTIP
jgi:hypothetical protein